MELAERYDDYCAACERDQYRVHVGAQSRPRLLEIDTEFEDVTSGDALDALARERDSATGTDARARLERWIQQIQTAVIQSRTRPLRMELRDALLRGASAERSAELREQLLAEEGSARAKLGHASGVARLRARLPGVDLESWRLQAERLLAATERAFSDLRGAALSRVGRSAADRSRGARAAALGLERFADGFPAERARACLEHSCESLGVAFAGCSWAEAARGRARSWPIRVPGEIALVLGSSSGPRAYAELFAAAGQAAAFAYTSPALGAEYRRPFDAAVGAAWGALLRGLVADPFWLEDYPSGPHAAELLGALAFTALYDARAAAGRLEHDRALAELEPGRDPRRASSLYAERMEEATGFEHPPEQYLVGADGELRSLDELRGQCLAAQLAALLRVRFGHKFWRSSGSGGLLKELWNTGSLYSAEEIASALDLGPLDVESLASDWARPALGAR